MSLTRREFGAALLSLVPAALLARFAPKSEFVWDSEAAARSFRPYEMRLVHYDDKIVIDQRRMAHTVATYNREGGRVLDASVRANNEALRPYLDTEHAISLWSKELLREVNTPSRLKAFDGFWIES